jgi:nucleoside-diphosphate-sugar epimerase
MNILIIGGTRFVGRAIAEVFLSQGHQVTLFNRGSSSVGGCLQITGDVENLTSFESELKAVAADVVVHCIASTKKNADDLARVFAGSKSRVLVLSSADCYEAFQQLNRGREVSDFPIDETMPTSSIEYYWREFPNHPGGPSYDKNLMSSALMQAFAGQLMLPTIFRLPQVYGPGDFQFRSRHGPIIRRILDGQMTFVLSDLDYGKLQTFGYIENIAAAVYHAAGTPVTAGKIYNLGERKIRSWRRWVELYATAAGLEFEFRVLPECVLRTVPVEKVSPPLHLIFDCEKFYQETGFVDPVTIEHCIAKTLAWARENPSCLGARPDYGNEARVFERFKAMVQALK